MKNRSSKIFIIVGLLLIAAALFIIGYNFIETKKAQNSVDEILSQLDMITEDAEKASQNMTDLNTDMLGKTVEGISLVGIIEIPSLDIVLPVAESLDNNTLKKVPCRYTGSAYSNDMVIAGHNYRSHFGKLSDIKPGAAVVFTDVNGNTFEYIAVEKEKLASTDIQEMTHSDWDLTLFTCTMDGQARVTIRCQAE